MAYAMPVDDNIEKAYRVFCELKKKNQKKKKQIHS